MPYEPSPAVYQGTFAAPSGTTSTAALVMLGLGATTSFALITPQVTGRVLLVISGIMGNANGDGTTIQLSYGTGAAPANGATLTGTQIGQQSTWTSLTGALLAPFCLSALITGLAVPTINAVHQTTAATQVWLDIAFKAVVGGTAALTNVNITALEV